MDFLEEQQRAKHHQREFITRNVNVLDMNNKNRLCKMLLIMGIDLKQTNNGVYCFFDALEDRMLNFVYDFVKVNLK